MALAPAPMPRLARSDLVMDPCTSVSRINAIKHMTVIIFMHLINCLITNKISWMKGPERSYMMFALSIWDI